MTRAIRRPGEATRDDSDPASNPMEPTAMDSDRPDVVDAEIPVIDSHHHLWHRSHQRYLMEEFEADASGGHHVIGSVFAECHEAYLTDGPPEMRPVGEARFVGAEARRYRARRGTDAILLGGFVGAADLRLGDEVDRVLDALDEASEGLFRGIRGAVYWDEDPALNLGLRPYSPKGLLLDPTYRKGFARLARRGLVYDAWQYEPQLPELCSLADAFPSATIVVNHCGGPVGINAYAGPDRFERWRRALREVARRDNVLLKLSGLSARRIGFGFEHRATLPALDELVRHWSPYVQACVEAFGPSRCLWGSNFPVDASVADYRTLLNAYKACLSGCSTDEKTAVLSGNAARVYRVGRPA
jgi:L-fuconolactonase